MSIEQLIDLERYPLDALETARGAQLVAQCRHDLKENALCLLPGFVHPQALEAMAGTGVLASDPVVLRIEEV